MAVALATLGLSGAEPVEMAVTCRRFVTAGLNVNNLPPLVVNEIFIWTVQPATGGAQVYTAFYDGASVWTTPSMTNRGKK